MSFLGSLLSVGAPIAGALIGSAVPGLGTLAGGLIGSAVGGAVGSQNAASTQAAAQTKAAQTQMDMFNAIKAQQQPFIQAGYGATANLADLMGTSGNTGAAGYGSLTKGFTPADYLANQDPGYQFQLQQGASAIRNADTPTAGALSGQTLKDLMTFNQNTAATGYNNAFNRFQQQNSNIFGRLSAIAGLGQNAAANTGTAGTQLGTGAAQAGAAAGGSQAAGIVGATQSGALAGLPLAYMMANQPPTPSPETAGGAGAETNLFGSGAVPPSYYPEMGWGAGAALTGGG